MPQDFKCFIGLHKYEVYKEESVVTARGNETGKVIISKCSNCGKIKVKSIKTLDERY